ncbi:hypothetical protein BGZ94_008616, partial [Podila epigama]
DKTFALLLETHTFHARPTKVSLWAVQYFVPMRLDPTPTKEDFMAHMRSKHPQIKKRSEVIWDQIMNVFYKRDPATLSALTSVAAVDEFIAAFEDDKEADPTAVLVTTVPPSVGPSTSSNARSNTSTTSSSSSSRLSIRAVENMKAEFERNYSDFKGESWILSSGSNVDEVVRRHVETLGKESPLHSFVVDVPETIIDLFDDPKDKEELKLVLIERAGEKPSPICQEELQYLRWYEGPPEKVERKLEKGWSKPRAPAGEQPLEKNKRQTIHMALHLLFAVYQRHHFELPSAASESFYLQILWGFIPMIFMSDKTLNYHPAEVHSQASLLRKNKNRKIESMAKQAVGRKVDGLVLSSSTMLELCVIEAANKDVGPSGSKALHDTKKLAKVLKDTFDAVCARCKEDIDQKLVVFGARIAGPSITFLSLRKRQGRFYQLVDEGTVTLPSRWDGSTTMTILAVIASVMALHKRVAEMATKVVAWTTPSLGSLANPSPHHDTPQTLTTPPGSPRLSRQ